MKMEKLVGWLKDSNRPTHVKMGVIIFVLTMMYSCALLSFAEGNLDIDEMFAQRLTVVSMLDSCWTVFLTMCAVEFMQMYSKVGKWDWLDVLAGCIFPVAATLVVSLVIVLC